MSNKLRFHLDEQINPRIASGLRRRGIDVTTTVDAALRAVDDGVQLSYALRTDRVLVPVMLDSLPGTEPERNTQGSSITSLYHDPLVKWSRFCH